MKHRLPKLILLLVLPGVIAAQCSHNDHSADHGDHAKYHKNVPAIQETGQGTFAAIAEIVAQLESNPETDWGKVNIKALRQHLQDMNFLMLYAEASEKEVKDGWQFTITGTGRTLAAIKNMVPMHAGELDKMDGLSAETKALENGVLLTVSSADQTMQTKLSGLGFFGLMALGSHHQIHHFHIASGLGHMKH